MSARPIRAFALLLAATFTGALLLGGSADAATTKTYSRATVAKHATAKSCWSIVNGNVYNLTAYIPYHPSGPQDVLAICGKNGSALFNAQHAGSRRANSELAQLLIGKAGK